MAFKSKKLTFHGSFKSKREAVKRESERPGSFILKRDKRFLVVTK